MYQFIFLGLVLSGPPSLFTPEESFELAVPGERSSEKWWDQFEDPLLVSIVEESIESNTNVEIAQSRLIQAQALVVQNFAGLLPSVSFDMSGSTVPFEDSTYAAMMPSTGDQPDYYTTGTALFGANLKLDLGSQTLAWRAYKYQASATSRDKDALELSVAAMVLGAAFDTIQARSRLRLIEEQVSVAESLHELVELRYQRGDVTGLDLLQQKQTLASAKAQIPSAKTALRVAEHRLLILMGRQVSDDIPALPEVFPQLPPTPSTGDPKDLLYSRPDLKAALDRVKASEKTKQSTVLSVLPSVTVSGKTGWKATKYGDETSTDDTWSVSGAVSVPIFNGGRAVAAVKSASASETSQVLTFNQAYIDAIQEVEIALFKETEQYEAVTVVKEQLDAATMTFSESRQRYISGETTFINVLSALQSKYQAELSYLSANRELLGARIALHQSLGIMPESTND